MRLAPNLHPLLLALLCPLTSLSISALARADSNTSAGHYQPSPAEQARADAVFHSFTQALRNADYSAGYALLDITLQTARSLSQWQSNEQSFAQVAGTHAGYSQPTASWYFDPPHAAKPGLYVEYRYHCHYAHLKPCQEVLALHSELGEEYRVIRHSRSYVNLQTGKRTGEFVRIPGQHSRIR